MQWYLANFFTWILLIASSLGVSNAQTTVDFNRYPERVHDSLYYELFKLNRESDINLAQHYAIKALELSEKHDNIDLIIKSLNALGFIYYHKNIYDSAIYYHTRTLESAIKYNREDRQMYSYCNLAAVFLNLSVVDKSLDYSFKALKLSRKLKIVDVEISSLNNIGLAYGKINSDLEALTYFEECLQVLANAGNQFQTNARTNIAYTYINLKRYSDAINAFIKILTNAKNDYEKIDASYGLASAYLKQSNLPESKKYAILALDLSKSNADNLYAARCYHLLGEIYYTEKNFFNALNYLKDGLGIAKGKFFKEEHDLNLLLSEIYFDLGNFKNSSIARERAYNIKDSLFNEQFAENFKNLHVNLANEKSDEIILTKEAEVEKQKLFVTGASVLSLIAMLAIFLIKRERNKLADAKAVIEKQNSELMLFNKSMEILIDERTGELKAAIESLAKANRRLDNIIVKTTQELHEPMMNLKAACEFAGQDLKEYPRAVEYVKRMEDSIQKVRMIFNNEFILNQIHKRTDLLEIIKFEELVNEVIHAEKRKGIPPKIEFKTFIARDINFQADRKMIKLILENLIGNAIKYYNPVESVHSVIDIDIYKEEGKLMMVITDNGVGIDNSTQYKMFKMPRPSQTIGGLYITKVACERLGGTITYGKSIEGYTEFTVVLPVEVLVEPFSHLN